MDMNLNEQLAGADVIIDDLDGVEAATATAGRKAAGKLPQMMRRIPVTLTLEVGSARVSLQELMAIGPNSVSTAIMRRGRSTRATSRIRRPRLELSRSIA